MPPARRSTTTDSARLSPAGTSVLPISRVHRIIKADKDIRLCSKEAIFLISKLTENMVARLADASHASARLQKRERTVKYHDIAQAVSSRPEFFYLQEVIPATLSPSAVLTAKAKAKAQADQEGADGLRASNEGDKVVGGYEQNVGPGGIKKGRKGRPSIAPAGAKVPGEEGTPAAEGEGEKEAEEAQSEPVEGAMEVDQ